MIACYEIVKKIGSGGRSDVYLVRNINTKMLMAMKVYRNATKEAEREVEILKLLGGKGAPFLIDRVEEEGKICVVMEYLEGMTLREYIRMHPVTSWEKSVSIIGDILAALIPMHMNEPPYVYGDIKPENIMITKTGQARLFDFGSVIREDEKDRPVYGTVGYMPKEDEKIGCERDIYGVGIIFYELLTGNILSRAVEKGSADISHFPSWVSRIMQKAVHIRKEERYKNASEMYAALLGGESGYDIDKAGKKSRQGDIMTDVGCREVNKERKSKRRNHLMGRKIKDKGNVYVAEVKRVALSGLLKGFMIFAFVYFAMNIFYNTLEAKAGTLYPDEEYIYEEYRYEESEDTYYDTYGRKVLFYDESMHKR